MVARIGLIDLELLGVDGHAAVGIHDSLGSEAEHILERLQGRLDLKLSEEGTLFLKGFLQPEIRDFQRRGVNLAEIVTFELLAKENSSPSDVGRIVAHAGPD